MKLLILSYMTCFICRDEANILYKLCDCESSTICVECYNLDLSSQMTHCALCRKKYKIKKKRNYSKCIKMISDSFVRNWLYPLVDLSIPGYIYYKKQLTIIVMLIIAFCIFFINSTNIHLIKLFNENRDDTKKFIHIFNTMKYALIGFMFAFILFERDNKQKIKNLLQTYQIMVLAPAYLLPFATFNTIIIVDNIAKYIKKLNRNTITKSIKIRSTIYIDNTNESTV